MTDLEQNETIPDVASIDIQEEIQWFMRPFLLDFLIEAHSFFQLLPETLHLSVNLLDRYCSRRVVYKRHYQLVGCAALLIAAKYGDRKERVPTIRELKSMCCSLYDEDMFTQMEWHVLNTLDWTIGAPTVDGFIQIAMQDSNMVDKVELEHMAWYISENALYHKEFVSTKPSVMASTSLTLARMVLRRPDVSAIPLCHEEQLTLLQLFKALQQPSQALARKYASSLLSRASDVVDIFMREHQAALVRQNTVPASPPMEEVVKDNNIYSTPVKVVQNSFYQNGYLTPPITPDGDCYGVPQHSNDSCGFANRRPITPTPASNYYTHGHQQQYAAYYQ